MSGSAEREIMLAKLTLGAWEMKTGIRPFTRGLTGMPEGNVR